MFGLFSMPCSFPNSFRGQFFCSNVSKYFIPIIQYKVKGTASIPSYTFFPVSLMWHVIQHTTHTQVYMLNNYIVSYKRSQRLLDRTKQGINKHLQESNIKCCGTAPKVCLTWEQTPWARRNGHTNNMFCQVFGLYHSQKRSSCQPFKFTLRTRRKTTEGSCAMQDISVLTLSLYATFECRNIYLLNHQF